MAGICECGNEPSGSIKCRKFLDSVSFSRRTLLNGVSIYLYKPNMLNLLCDASSFAKIFICMGAT